MSILNITNKQLLANIKGLHERRGKINLSLHVAACQCVWRAATPEGGRAEPLQALYDGLTKAEQGMLLAWLSKKANTFGIVDQSKNWIAIKGGKFSIVGGAVANRPTMAAIETVANDFTRFFLNRSIQHAVKLTWDEELKAKVTALVNYMTKHETDGLSTDMIESAKALQSNVVSFINAKKPTPAPVVETPKMDRRTRRRVLAAIETVVGDVPVVESQAA